MKELKGKISTVARSAASKPKPEQIEQSLDRLSYLLDGLFRIPGTGWRFGLDALVGLIPGIGDTATSLASFYILAAGVRYRVPKITLVRMGLNIAVDYLFGLFPIIGDVFDAAWKSNERNVELLKKRATVTAVEAKTAAKKSDWIFVGVIILVLIGLLVGSFILAIYILKVIGQLLGLWT
jgi:hypothetical protein